MCVVSARHFLCSLKDISDDALQLYGTRSLSKETQQVFSSDLIDKHMKYLKEKVICGLSP